MSTTICKFRIDSVNYSVGSKAMRDADGYVVKDQHGHTRYESARMASLVASPVYANGDPDHENSKFWDASPGGQFRLDVVNIPALKALAGTGDERDLVGREIYLEIRLVPKS